MPSSLNWQVIFQIEMIIFKRNFKTQNENFLNNLKVMKHQLNRVTEKPALDCVYMWAYKIKQVVVAYQIEDCRDQTDQREL